MPCGSALQIGVFAGSLLVLSGCDSSPIVTTAPQTPGTKQFSAATAYRNGAVVSYALPKGMLKVAGKYDFDKNTLEITNVSVVNIPDPAHTYNLIYQHIDTSHDTFSIQKTSDGLLKSIGTTDDDRTVEIAKKGVELLSAVTEIIKVAEVKAPPEPTKEKTAFLTTEEAKPCGLFTFSEMFDIDQIDHNKKSYKKVYYKKNIINPEKSSCYVDINISKSQISIDSVRNLDTSPQIPGDSQNIAHLKNSIYYANTPSKLGKGEEKYNCIYAVCFKNAALYQFEVQLTTHDVEKTKKETKKTTDLGKFKNCIKIDKPDDKSKECETQVETKTEESKQIVKLSTIKTTNTALLTAPHDGPLGVLYFWRKSFVKNATTATFENGMLTGLTVDNPSQIEGFLSLPIELLKAVPILIAVN